MKFLVLFLSLSLPVLIKAQASSSEIRGGEEYKVTTYTAGETFTIKGVQDGWCFRPGISVGFAGSEVAVGVDSQVAYSGPFGLNIGILAGFRQDAFGIRPSLYGALSYNFEWISPIVGVDSNKQILLGLRVRF